MAKAVAPLLNPGARVPICGYVSSYNLEQGEESETPFQIFGALSPPPVHRFFLVHEWADRHQEITRILRDMILAGDIKYTESVGEGLESAPAEFVKMLAGRNFGKQLIKVAD